MTAHHRIVMLSDAHFFTPHYYQAVVKNGGEYSPPSRLPTDLALGDTKANPFAALIQLARDDRISAESLVCCGDITMCADPTAMNLGWLQIHRLADALGVDEPIVTAGNHDVDSRFQTSTTSPARMLRYLDPPFPVSDSKCVASYWAHGYCIVDRGDARFVLVNTCSLHGYTTPEDRHLDHGSIPEQLFDQLADDLSGRPACALNILVCHHHPREIDLPPEDRSVIDNGDRLTALLETIGPSPWLILHGHRHLPSVAYASASPASPVIFSSGSLAVDLHLRLQGRTANQFYELAVFVEDGLTYGDYRAWTWDQNEGQWLEAEETRALPAAGGFGHRVDPLIIAAEVSEHVPPRDAGTIKWSDLEALVPRLRFVIRDHRKAVIELLKANHNIGWYSEGNRVDAPSSLLTIGRV